MTNEHNRRSPDAESPLHVALSAALPCSLCHPSHLLPDTLSLYTSRHTALVTDRWYLSLHPAAVSALKSQQLLSWTSVALNDGRAVERIAAVEAGASAEGITAAGVDIIGARMMK